MSLTPLQFFWGHFTTRITKPDADLTGRVCLVTGANQGLGYATAVHFARMNASRIIIACRQVKRGEAACANVYKACPAYRGKIDVMQLDLSSFDSVKAFAEEVNNDPDRLDIAVLNAGVVKLEWKMTPDGWEESLQVNYLSTGLLAMLLLPKLSGSKSIPLATSPAAGKKGIDKPHLVILSSAVHYWAQFKQQDSPVLLSALNDRNMHDPDDTYNISKALDVFLARQISSLPSASGIVVNSVNPGLCKSELRRDMPFLLAWFFNQLSWSAEFGSRTSVIAAVTDTTPGAYVSDGKETPAASFITSAKGKAIQQKLWDESIELWKTLAPQIAATL